MGLGGGVGVGGEVGRWVGMGVCSFFLFFLGRSISRREGKR